MSDARLCHRHAAVLQRVVVVELELMLLILVKYSARTGRRLAGVPCCDLLAQMTVV